jgi:hypothetical protein
MLSKKWMERRCLWMQTQHGMVGLWSLDVQCVVYMDVDQNHHQVAMDMFYGVINLMGKAMIVFLGIYADS